MKGKLTLTLEKDLIEKAKVFARENKQNLSEIVGKYLEEIDQKQQPDPPTEEGEIVSSLKGLFAPKAAEKRQDSPKRRGRKPGTKNKKKNGEGTDRE